jgi:prepilin-type N-terminal cleavage/methylation domain-containing protein/prepilin-type processing-associated H-X9-DG protein
MHAAQRRAFTLIEIIVVLGIIAVLLALILPAVQGARQSAWRTQCASNMRQIGQAYQQYVDQHNMTASSFRASVVWPKQLKEYLSSRDDMFICINDDQKGGAAAPTDPSVPTLPKASIYVRSSTMNAQQIKPAVANGGVGQDLLLTLTTTNPKQGVKQVPAPKGQSDVPGVVYLVVETGWIVDWDDLIMRVETIPPERGGGFVITPVSEGSAPFVFDLKGPNGEIISADFKPGSQPAVIPGGAGGGFPTSYAVNSQAQFFLSSTDTNKVLCIEYNRPVITITKSGFVGNWAAEIAPRHGGSANVLFRDATVQNFVPSEVDPNVPTNLLEKWLPNNPG